uniref:Uncharacterized protein n=1 Tax=Peronospora matthiolae TaxID=2874970 RepID=A0AAV1UV58_9STRA
MSLLKQLFEDFLAQSETSLRQFVNRGDQVISVIPFELPPSKQSLSPCFVPLHQGSTFRPVEENVDTQQGQVPMKMKTKRNTMKPIRKQVTDTEKRQTRPKTSRPLVVNCTGRETVEELGMKKLKRTTRSSVKTRSKGVSETVQWANAFSSAGSTSSEARPSVSAQDLTMQDASADTLIAQDGRDDVPTSQAVSSDASTAVALMSQNSLPSQAPLSAKFLSSQAVPAGPSTSQDMSINVSTNQTLPSISSTSEELLAEAPTSRVVPAGALICRAVPAEALTPLDSSAHSLTSQAVMPEAPIRQDVSAVALTSQALSKDFLTSQSAVVAVLTSQDSTAGVSTSCVTSADVLTHQHEPADTLTRMPLSTIVLTSQVLLVKAASNALLSSEAERTENCLLQSDSTEPGVAAMQQRQRDGDDDDDDRDAFTSAIAGDERERTDTVSVSATEPASKRSERVSIDALPLHQDAAGMVTESTTAESAHPDVGTEPTCLCRRLSVADTTNAKPDINTSLDLRSTSEMIRERGATVVTNENECQADLALAKTKSPLGEAVAIEAVLNTLSPAINPTGEASSLDVLPSEAQRCKAVPTVALEGSQGNRKRNGGAETGNERPHKRDKLLVSEEKSLSQLHLAQKLKAIEAKAPWKTVYNNLPVPFDETNHPILAKKLSQFWRKHSRAVWERNFWAPMSRKLNLADFNKRNNRQFSAKTAFESLIVSVYGELGAAFFVKLDKEKPRHPGWWYYGPVVALFALHQIKGAEAMWNYVDSEALKRFPDCKLPVPLTAANSGAIRSRYKGESRSMWMANHYMTMVILREIEELKAEQQVCKQAETSDELEQE